MSMPKEPRQMMINMMYLVLTAMLALNVSTEILHAFKTINQSILSSNSSIEEKNRKIYDAFDAMENDPTTHDDVKPYNDKAKQVRQTTEDLLTYLNGLKLRIISNSGGYADSAKGELMGESNIDAATHMFIENKGGDTLQTRIKDARNFFLGVVKPTIKDTIARQLPLNIVAAEKSDNNPSGNWNEAYFHNMPVMAAVTLISKFQNDARNSEAMILNELSKEAGETKLTFDELEAIAVPKTSYALAGQKIEATILLAAYNKSVNPVVTKSAGNVTKIEHGVAYWETVANGVGKQTVKGTVSIDLGGGKKQTKPYSFDYMVGSEGASLQLDKMNVFYIGVDNPVTVSAAGYSIEDVSISFPSGEVKPNPEGGKGHYLLTAKTPSSAEGVKVSIIARTQSGASKEVGTLNVRVKRIPDPIAKVGGKPGGYMPASQFRPQIGVQADLENFDFKTSYTIISYEYRALKKGNPDLVGGFKNLGASWAGNKDIQRVQADLKSGDRVFIDEIKAKGPDGTIRSLNSLSFTLL